MYLQKKSANACAASFPLGSIIPKSKSYIFMISPAIKPAVVPLSMAALLETFIYWFFISISYFFAKYRAVMHVIIFVNEAISLILSP